jgi:monovalent cation/hydrogen antiporter
VREQYAAARKVAEDQNEPQAATRYDELRLRAIAAQRAALHRLRARGEIGEEAFHRIQEELDWSELDAAPAGSFQIAGELRQIADAAPVAGESPDRSSIGGNSYK